MVDLSQIHLSRLQSFGVGAVGVWGLLASVATAAFGPGLWTGLALADHMRVPEMQCGERSLAEQVHRAAQRVPAWAPLPVVQAECIAVPARALSAGHRVVPEDLITVFLPDRYDIGGLRRDGGVGERLLVDVTAREPIFEGTVGRISMPSKPLAPPLPSGEAP